MERIAKYRSSRPREDPSIAESASPSTGAPGFNLFPFSQVIVILRVWTLRSYVVHRRSPYDQAFCHLPYPWAQEMPWTLRKGICTIHAIGIPAPAMNDPHLSFCHWDCWQQRECNRAGPCIVISRTSLSVDNPVTTTIISLIFEKKSGSLLWR